jgi:hypothetical protein
MQKTPDVAPEGQGGNRHQIPGLVKIRNWIGFFFRPTERVSLLALFVFERLRFISAHLPWDELPINVKTGACGTSER